MRHLAGKITLILLTLLAFAGCGKDDSTNRLNIETVPFVGNGATKMTVAGPDCNWQGGEPLLVNGQLATVTLEGGRATVAGVPAADRYRALYPTTIATGSTTADEITISLPSIYHYATTGGSQSLALPLAANSTSGRLLMQHLTGALRLVVSNTSGVTMTVDRITIASDRYALSGRRPLRFADLGALQPVPTDDEAARSVSLTMDRERLDIAAGGSAELFVPVAAVGADNHFTVEIEARYRGTRYTYRRIQSAGGALGSNQLGYAPAEINNAASSTIAATNLLPGLGTEDEPYLVASALDMMIVAEAINGSYPASLSGSTKYNQAHIALTADIDMSGFTLAPIAGFRGHFDGRGHRLTGLTVAQGEAAQAGLFATLAAGSSVRGLTLKDLTLSTTYKTVKAGALCGQAESATIADCHVDGLAIDAPTATTYNVGGLVYELRSATGEATVEDCTTRFALAATLAGSNGSVGGIVAEVTSPTKAIGITRCSSTTEGPVLDGGCSRFGGIVARITTGGALPPVTIEGCQWEGAAELGCSAAIIAGGLVGESSHPTVLSNSTAAGSIMLTTSNISNAAGGLIGAAARGKYTLSASTATVTLVAPGGTTSPTVAKING